MLERRLYRRLPVLQRLARAAVYVAREALVPGMVKWPPLMKVVERAARRHMASQVPDPVLRERVTPDYEIGCKRMLPSSDWYPALAQPNVELVTDAIAEVRARSVVDAAGVEREVDAIVFGTGFRVTDHPAAERIRGRGGRLLADDWNGSPRAHLGTTVAGFPNLFFLLGPNTGLGHSSMVYMIESQIAHVLRALDVMRERVRGHDRGPPRGARALQRRARPPARAHRVEHRLRELVHRRDGPQLDAVAGLDVALPPPRRPRRPRRVSAHGFVTIRKTATRISTPVSAPTMPSRRAPRWYSSESTTSPSPAAASSRSTIAPSLRSVGMK